LASLLILNGFYAASSVPRNLHLSEGFGVTAADFRSSLTRPAVISFNARDVPAKAGASSGAGNGAPE
jgi:hypothetical protein